MTRKDYETLAAAIKDAPVFYREGREAKLIVAESIADAIAKQAPKFDRALFLRNCGVTS